MKMPLPPWRATAFEAAGKQAVLAGRDATSAGLFSPADRAYMKPPALAPAWTSGQVSPMLCIDTRQK